MLGPWTLGCLQVAKTKLSVFSGIPPPYGPQNRIPLLGTKGIEGAVKFHPGKGAVIKSWHSFQVLKPSF